MEKHKFTRFEAFLFKIKSKTLINIYVFIRCKIPIILIKGLKLLVDSIFTIIAYFSPEKKMISPAAATPMPRHRSR